MIEHKKYRYEDIRNFYFENEKGQRIDCQKVNGGLFLYNVNGLGFEKEVEYVRVGNTYVKNEEHIKQNIINGELEFYDMTYDEYKSFVDFIIRSENLKIIYVPKLSNRTEYYRDIDFVRIDKSEEDVFNVMMSPIQINCKSLWYKQNIVSYTIEPLSDEIRWDFRWDSSFTDYNSRSLQYINDGHVEAPIEVEISGRITNPRLELYIEGQLFQSVTFNVEISVYEKLLYGTKENEFYLMKQKADGTKESLFNLDVLQDFENDYVIRIPTNKSCELKIEAENEVLNAKVTIYPQYIAV